MEDYYDSRADRELTEQLKRIAPDRFVQRANNPLTAYRCECNSGYCYKILRLRTIQKRSMAPRLRCPACQECATHSTHVRVFAETVRTVNNNIRIVWDWKCFVGDAHRSIDATVLCGLGAGSWCACFEIDGSVHFSANLTSRKDCDIEKDQQIETRRWGLMRLHYKDEDVWHKYIKLHLLKPNTGICYTDSYVHCMGRVPQIVRSNNL